ncbi:facilitated trehalose transporter Tret1-like [Photinus pyralis]|nr:facilitated trehalose transporter Tret1-like [Photinus pyralis]XP_031358267.1 facilitated trehalose transporter Tret1-like [Photinus pyralis]
MKATNRLLEKRPLQYSAAATGLLVAFCSGLNLGWTSPYLPILLSEHSPIKMTASESSWLGTTYLLGGLCGSILLSIVGRKIGRKTILFWSSVPFFTAWAVIAFATTLPILLIGRIITGLTQGLAFATLPMYLSEISDKEIRGFLCSLITVFLYVGAMVINVIGTYMTIKISSLICLIIPVLQFVAFFWMPESPNYLLMKGKREKARQELIALKGADAADRSLDVIVDVIEEEMLSKTGFISIFEKNNRSKLLTLFGLRLTQQFCGVIAFNISAQTIFQESADSISPLLGTIVLYTVQIVFSVLSSLAVDKLGRKPLLIVSTIGTICVLLAGGAFFFIRDVIKTDTSHVSFVPALILIVFTFCYSLGLQTMPNFMAAELYPTNLKPYACTIGDVMFYSFSTIVSQYFQFTKDNYGLYVPFWSFAVSCIIGLGISVIFMPETKNKTLEDIQKELSRKQKKGKK